MSTALGTVSVAPDILDGALAIVVDGDGQTMAVWKGRNRIDLYALDGSWHDVVGLGAAEEHGTWGRDEVLAQAAAAISSLGPRPSSPRPEHEDVLAGVDDLRRAWLVRARANGYAVWDGGQVVEVYGPDGARRRQVGVTAGDLASISKLMLGLLDQIGRQEDVSALT